MDSFDFDFDLFFYPLPKFLYSFEVHRKTSFITRRNHPIHIATAGGFVPEFCYENKFNNRLRSYLKSKQSNKLTEYKTNPELKNIIEQSLSELTHDTSHTAMDLYLHDFVNYAKRGCFSFDRTNLNDPNDTQYHLVAFPHHFDSEELFPWHHEIQFNFHLSHKKSNIILLASTSNHSHSTPVGYAPLY